MEKEWEKKQDNFSDIEDRGKKRSGKGIVAMTEATARVEYFSLFMQLFQYITSLSFYKYSILIIFVPVRSFSLVFLKLV